MDLSHACLLTGRRDFKFLQVKNTEEKTESRAAGRRAENIEAKDKEYIRGTRC